MMRASRKLSTPTSCSCACAAPLMPMLAPASATGLPASTWPSASLTGRESQSIRFFSGPGMAWLYSGLNSHSPSARLTSSRTRATAAGAGCSVSWFMSGTSSQASSWKPASGRSLPSAAPAASASWRL